MFRENNPPTPKKRALKKLRTQFLHKKENFEEVMCVDPATKHLSGHNIFTVKSRLGFVEINRKICSGPHYLSPFYKITAVLDDISSNKIIILNLTPKPQTTALPWEYVEKRLESYGDLELATWAHRIDQFHELFSLALSLPEHSYQKGDIIIRNPWSDVRARAIKARQKIEENHAFHRVIFSFTKDTAQMVSHSFSKGLLEEMGYSFEDFMEWVKLNGMPIIFDTDSVVFKQTTKLFFEFTVFLADPIYETAEYDVYIHGVNRSKKKITVQVYNILEPTADGFLSYYYFVIRNRNPDGFKCNKTTRAVDSDDLSLCTKYARLDLS